MTGGSEATARALEHVADIVRMRGDTHGDAIAQHQTQARMVSAYIGSDITAADCAVISVLMKISRYAEGDKAEPDHLRDVLGSAAIASVCAEAQCPPRVGRLPIMMGGIFALGTGWKSQARRSVASLPWVPEETR